MPSVPTIWYFTVFYSLALEFYLNTAQRVVSFKLLEFHLVFPKSANFYD